MMRLVGLCLYELDGSDQDFVLDIYSMLSVL